MKNTTKQDRLRRVVARGETSNHCHVVCGDDVLVREEKGTTMISVSSNGAVLRHLLEDVYVETGVETWTGEHTDIALPQGDYRYVAQMEFNPLDETIKQVKD